MPKKLKDSDYSQVQDFWTPVAWGEEKENDSDPNPMRRTPGITWEKQFVPTDDLRQPNLNIATGYMDPNEGGEWELPPSAPQAPGPRRGIYGYERRATTSDPTPEMPGAE